MGRRGCGVVVDGGRNSFSSGRNTRETHAPDTGRLAGDRRSGDARRAAAADDPLSFVHALQEKGYADEAAQYLAEQKAAGDLPPELAAVYDLEMARCLHAVAKQAHDAGRGPGEVGGGQ